MADFADQASERQAELEADALAMRKPEGPKATGYCLQCGADLAGPMLAGLFPPDVVDIERVRLWLSASTGRRWCDSQCRDEWERKNS